MRDKNSSLNRHLAALLLITSLLLIVAPAAAPYAQQAQPKRVIVISLDGLDFRYLENRDKFGLKIPALRRLMSEGAWARVVGVYPSVTYPSHTTIVTGARPSVHGVYGNEIFERPDRPLTYAWNWFARDLKADTLWDAAARRGLKTAMISWPVSAGAGDYNFPEIWKPGGSREETYAVIRGAARPSGLVEEVERSDPALYSRRTKDESDDIRTRFAEHVIAEKRPDFVLVHLFDLDHFEHEKGPFTPEAFEMLEKVDGYVARILSAAERAGTLQETAIFIVSDHGFLPVSKRIYPGVVLARAGLVELIKEKGKQGGAPATGWLAAPQVSGGSCAIILRDARDRGAYRKALAAFRDFLKGEGKGSLRILEARDLRGLATNPNAAFFLEASDGYYFESGYAGEAIRSDGLKGQHGYLPGRYYTSFIASGAGVRRRGSLGTIRLTDEGPTIARTLGLQLRNAEGRAVGIK